MAWARSLTWVVLSSMLLSGCFGKDATETVQGPNGEIEEVDVQATADTGIIRGVVVDAAIRPIAGASVSVRAGQDTLLSNTTASGQFGFEGLKPGTYFVKATKAGFVAVQTSVDVVAGLQEPRAVKIALDVDTSYVKPYVNVVKYDGFVECTSSVLVLCGAPNLVTGENVTNDRFTWNQYFEDNATLIQSEMFWDSSQAASTSLYFEMETLEGGCTTDGTFLNSTSGNSPIYTKVFNPLIVERSVGTKCPIYYSVFSGDAVEGQTGSNPSCNVPTGLPPPVDDTPCVGIGATFQQPFSMVVHSFYQFTPPSTWRFSTDGNPVPPA